MPVKGISVSLEKRIKKASAGLEDLFNFFSSTLEKVAETAAERKVARKPVTRKMVKATKAKVSKKPKPAKAGASKRGRRAGGGLKEALFEICKGSGGPITEAEIAKKLLEDQDKYKWNKNESTLYQTLRRAVKEKMILDSGRDKSTKTYQVA